MLELYSFFNADITQPLKEVIMEKSNFFLDKAKLGLKHRILPVI
jgi:hypothetical protein